jgi:hypothetical protein
LREVAAEIFWGAQAAPEEEECRDGAIASKVDAYSSRIVSSLHTSVAHAICLIVREQ